jgi:hypothetical protein
MLKRDRIKEYADKVIYNLQDQFLDLRRAVAARPASADATDPSLAETRYSGIVRAKVESFHRDLRDPMVAAMNKHALDYDKVGEFAHARTAEERNLRMQEINPTQAELDAKRAEIKKRLAELDALPVVTQLQAVRAKLAKAESEFRDGLADDSLPESYRQRLRTLKKSKEAKAPKAAKAGKRTRAKITPELKQQVIAAVQAGQSGAEISKALGMSLPSVQNIKKEAGLVKSRGAAEAAPAAPEAPAAV